MESLRHALITSPAPTWPSLLMLAALAMGPAACGEGNGDSNGNSLPDPISSNSNNTSTSGENNPNATTPNANNSTTANNTNNSTAPNNNTSQSSPNNNTSPDNSVTPPSQAFCDRVEDLGTIGPDSEPRTLQGSTVDQRLLDGYVTACGAGPAPEVGWEMVFDAPTRVVATITPTSQARWALEVRRGECADSEGFICNTTNPSVFVVDAGEPVLLIAEPQSNVRGTFELELQFDTLVCLPIDSTRCDGDDMLRCEMGGNEEIPYTCGEPCRMGSCGANTCDNAVEVTSFPYTFEGSFDSYSSSIDFDQDNTCINPALSATPGEPDPGEPDNNIPDVEPGAMAGPIETLGPDVFFSLPGLTAGQKLTVRADSMIGDRGDSVIFVLDACDPMQCLLATDLGDRLNEWEIPASGDYLVIVDRRGLSGQDLAVSIDVQ